MDGRRAHKAQRRLAGIRARKPSDCLRTPSGREAVVANRNRAVSSPKAHVPRRIEPCRVLPAALRGAGSANWRATPPSLLRGRKRSEVRRIASKYFRAIVLSPDQEGIEDKPVCLATRYHAGARTIPSAQRLIVEAPLRERSCPAARRDLFHPGSIPGRPGARKFRRRRS